MGSREVIVNSWARRAYLWPAEVVLAYHFINCVPFVYPIRVVPISMVADIDRTMMELVGVDIGMDRRSASQKISITHHLALYTESSEHCRIWPLSRKHL